MNPSVTTLRLSLRPPFLHAQREFLPHKKFHSHSLTVSLFLSFPCQSVPCSFMYMHTSPAAALSGLGRGRWRQETQMKRQTARGMGKAKKGQRGRGREGERESVTESERERGSEILLIHRDRLRYRGNVVSIVTALLRMPLVGNKKRTPLTAGMSHTKTQQSPTYI